MVKHAIHILTTTVLPVALITASSGSHAKPASIPTVIVGGSAAKGWNDQRGPGYIVRALQAYQRHSSIHFIITNHGKPGAPVVDAIVAQQFPHWMQQTRGGLVVIAWGLLNDLRLKTSKAAVLNEVHREIRIALKTDHVVLVVSPPTTLGTLTFDKTTQPALWHAIVREAQSFHNPNIYIADILGPMKNKMMGAHQTIQHYMSGKWDPNSRGHIEAGKLLAQKLQTLWPQAFPQPHQTKERLRHDS